LTGTRTTYHFYQTP